jgi:putative flippase GtrA
VAEQLGAPARFVALGAASFSLNLGVTAVLHELFGVPPEACFAVALVTVFCVNFMAMRWWVFRGSPRPWLAQLVGYGLSSLFFRGGEYLGYLLLYRLAGIPYLVAALVVLSVSFGLKYFVYGSWLFAREEP